MNEQAIRDVAIDEILHPTLSNTRQFLEVNTVVVKEHVPVVEDVIYKEEGQTAAVYFPIEGERYYIVVHLDVEPQLTLQQTEMSAETLCILWRPLKNTALMNFLPLQACNRLIHGKKEREKDAMASSFNPLRRELAR